MKFRSAAVHTVSTFSSKTHESGCFWSIHFPETSLHSDFYKKTNELFASEHVHLSLFPFFASDIQNHNYISSHFKKNYHSLDLYNKNIGFKELKNNRHNQNINNVIPWSEIQKRWFYRLSHLQLISWFTDQFNTEWWWPCTIRFTLWLT